MVTKDDASGIGGKPAGKGAAAVRKARLAEELRANLRRRKQQTRARRAGDADQRPEGIEPGKPDSGG